MCVTWRASGRVIVSATASSATYIRIRKEDVFVRKKVMVVYKGRWYELGMCERRGIVTRNVL